MKRMNSRSIRWMAALTGVCGAIAMSASAAAAAPVVGHSEGTLPDGGTWIADVPAHWNGTLLLYSHGYGPPVAQDMSDPTTQNALLGMGYALAGSSYDPTGPWWALGSAVRDQFETETIVKRTVLKAKPSKVYAVGTSMGGLVSALEDQGAAGRINGSLTTCGLVAGANQLNQYQLDGEYAIAQLLAPNEHIQLTDFTVGPPTFSDSAASAAELDSAISSAQTTAQGRARLALAFAFLNVSPWGGSTQPGVDDFLAQEQGQYDGYTSTLFGGPLTPIDFIVEGRDQIEAAAGGEGAGTVGVDFGGLLRESSYYPEVRALYDAAGLRVGNDLSSLARHATLVPDRGARRSLTRSSVPTGHLQVPELDIHTISDPLIPVQQERYYANLVHRAGDARLLRQAFVAAQGHCAFTPAELIAGLKALQSRVRSGRWDNVATPDALNAAANGLPSDLGGGAYTPFWPERLTGAASSKNSALAAR
jgi:hypothetical protein